MAQKVHKIASNSSILPLLFAIIITGILMAAFPLVGIGIAVLVLIALLVAARPYWVVLFLTLFMPFETFALKFFLPHNQIHLALQFAGEVLIYLTLIMVILRNGLLGSGIRRTPIDLPLLALILIILLSLLFNRSQLVPSLINIRTQMRYVALFYLVVNLNLNEDQVRYLLRGILAIGAIQVILGGLQLLSNGSINDLLIPKNPNTELFGYSRNFILVTRGREIGSIFGSLGDTLFYGLFLVLVLAVYLSGLRRLTPKRMIVIVFIVGAIFYSYARAVVLSVLLLLLIFAWKNYGPKRTLMGVVVLGFLAFILLVILSSTTQIIPRDYAEPIKAEQSIITNITGIFSQDYLELAKRQRLGALVGIAPTALVNRPLLGYGPDEMTTIERLNTSRPSFLLKTLTVTGFEDVYWVALLCYYGVPGVSTVAFLLLRIYQSARRVQKQATSALLKQIAMLIVLVVPLTAILLFFYRVLEFRIYSFYFWLLPACMYSLYIQERKGIVSSVGQPLSATVYIGERREP